MDYEDMSDDQRLVFLAAAKRVTAKEIWVNGWLILSAYAATISAINHR